MSITVDIVAPISKLRQPFRQRTTALSIAIVCVASVFLVTAHALAEVQRGTLVQDETIRVAPSADAAKLGEAGRGKEVIIIENTHDWVHVQVILSLPSQEEGATEEEQEGKTISGWVSAKGLVSTTTQDGDKIIFGEAADSEDQASRRRGRRDAAGDAMRLYYRVYDLMPASPLAAEALYRSADVRWQMERHQAADAAHRHSIKMPGSDKVLQARFLDGKQPAWKENVHAHRVGRLVDLAGQPLFRQGHRQPHVGAFLRHRHHRSGGRSSAKTIRPAIPNCSMNWAERSSQHHFDLQFLIRAITASRRISEPARMTDPAGRSASVRRMPVKGLTAEQTFRQPGDGDRLSRTPDDPGGFNASAAARAEFLTKFANSSDKRTEHQTSILQALSLMNGSSSPTPPVWTQRDLAAPRRAVPGHRQRLDALYLAALGRPMRPREAERLVPYVERGGPSGDRATRSPMSSGCCSTAANSFSIINAFSAYRRGSKRRSLQSSRQAASQEGVPHAAFSHLSRRDWLRLSAAGVTAYSMSGWLERSPPTPPLIPNGNARASCCG